MSEVQTVASPAVVAMYKAITDFDWVTASMNAGGGDGGSGGGGGDGGDLDYSEGGEDLGFEGDANESEDGWELRFEGDANESDDGEDWNDVPEAPQKLDLLVNGELEAVGEARASEILEMHDLEIAALTWASDAAVPRSGRVLFRTNM
ncbi:hypothetical protein B9G98_01316 [Wickerhamiella sorbophila]|uniref:Uncharacterized protein n=1 Tax=Wickerhamiella sorbophila TaxID=45607 RepID=A0A2T0FFC5_9ASCO|nr:hypothetical protein B9G98_01316 [Wickerhamiella sorbophila]PRT53696.1 hypothetical protein B9G98_01316 [Wickerhamiella sorbophila]